jgi:hypothetical protein
MKSLKIYFIIVGVLVLIALVAVVYVWVKVQSLQSMAENVEFIGGDNSTLDEPASSQGDESRRASDSQTSQPAPEPIAIQKADLTSGQQKVLDTVGIGAPSFTITSSMISCAESEFGAARVEEIKNGATPGPLEALKLLGCSKQQ